MALELVHGKPDKPGFEVLDLGHTTWKQLVALGLDNGWVPPDSSKNKEKPDNEHVCNFSGWYFWDRPAEVPRQVALEWAAALKRAIEIPELKDAKLPDFFKKHKNGTEIALSDPNYSRFNGLSREMVERFIKFLKHGAFIYAVWD
jgi:hypothetical protein